MASPPESSLSAFLPAFQESRNASLKAAALEQERESRLMDRMMDWNKYISDQKTQSDAAANKEAFQAEFDALDPTAEDYGTQVHRIATKYGQEIEGSSLIPKKSDVKPEVEASNVRAGIQQALNGNAASAANIMETYRGQKVLSVTRLDDTNVSIETESGTITTNLEDELRAQASPSTVYSSDQNRELEGVRHQNRLDYLKKQDESFKKKAEKKKDDVDESTALKMLRSLRTDIERVPQSVGVGGAMVGSDTYGIARQIPGASSVVDSMISPEAADEIRRIRGRAEALFGQVMPGLINEEGGRYSEGDVARAKRAYKILNVSSDLEEVMKAIGTIEEILTGNIDSKTGGEYIVDEVLSINGSMYRVTGFKDGEPMVVPMDISTIDDAEVVD
jgi:hypothetical protein